MVLGCVVDAVGSSGACRLFVFPPFLFAGAPLVVGVAPWLGLPPGVGLPRVGVVPACCGGVVWGVFVLAD